MSRYAHALITGGGRGIGRAFALALASADTRITLVDIDEHAARRVAAELAVRGAHAQVLGCDVSDARAVERLAVDAEQSFGPVDLLTNNAGVLAAGAAIDTPRDHVARAFNVNWWGVLHGCNSFAPRMLARRHGHILNVASLAGVMPLPQLGAYGATKAAVIAYSETLAAELSGSGVGVTILCPSFVRTGFAARADSSEQVRALGERLLGTAGQSPEHVAAVGLRAAARKQLFAVPSRSGALAWRLKRTAPRTFSRIAAAAARLTAGLSGGPSSGNLSSAGLSSSSLSSASASMPRVAAE